MSILSALFGNTDQDNDNGYHTAQDPTMVEGVDVVAPRRQQQASPDEMSAPPQSSGGNRYDNRADVDALHQWVQNNQPQGGSVNPGIFGLLPQGAQHGTLRNVLGALGDAFLVQSGNKPVYRERMERQQMGDAMAGYDNDPQAAIQRVGATGATGAPEMADKMQQNYNNLALHRDQLAALQANRDAQNQARQQGIYARLTPMAQGMVSAAKDQGDYIQRYQNLDRRVKMMDPSASAADAFGIPEPDDWAQTPGYGMSSNQQQQAADRAANRDQSNTNNIRTTGQSNTNNIRTTGQSDVNNQRTTHQSDVNSQRASARGLPGGVHGGGRIPVQNYGANNPVANGGKPLTVQQAATLDRGVHFLGLDGKWHIKH